VVPDKNELRINHRIRIKEVFLIGADGTKIGPTPTEEALQMAREAGLDLVEVSPNERPPVAKILDYGKLKYRQKKKAAGQKAHQAKVKGIRLHPRTDDHDIDVRIKQARKFLSQGDKVMITCFFKGREIAHRDFGFRLMSRFRDEFQLEAKIEKDASFEGKRLTMMLAPLAADIKKKLQREAEQQELKAEEEASKGRRVISLEESKKSAESAPLKAAADPAKADGAKAEPAKAKADPAKAK